MFDHFVGTEFCLAKATNATKPKGNKAHGSEKASMGFLSVVNLQSVGHGRFVKHDIRKTMAESF